ncbi:MAG: hypothetical protein JW976_02645 [Syntrophaceae bacterium]|nr:hypothetical protein [Syntrophaceae bacterium]
MSFLPEHVQNRVRDIFSAIISVTALLSLFIVPIVRPMTTDTPKEAFYIFIVANILALTGVILGGKGIRISQNKKLLPLMSICIGCVFWITATIILWAAPRYLNL